MSARTSSSSCTVATSGIMISGRGSPPALMRRAAASRIARACIANRPGMTMPSRTPRRPSIGFSSCSRLTASSSLCCLRVAVAALVHQRDLDRQVGVVGQELVQRRVDQPDRHRQPVHRLEDAREVLALHRQQLGERLLLLVARPRRGSGSRPAPSGRRGTCARCGTARCPGRRTGGPGRRRRGVGVGAHRRGAGVSSACSISRATAGTSSLPPVRGVAASSASPSKQRTTRESATGTSPTKTSPVVPSMEITSPSDDRGAVGWSSSAWP